MFTSRNIHTGAIMRGLGPLQCLLFVGDGGRAHKVKVVLKGIRRECTARNPIGMRLASESCVHLRDPYRDLSHTPVCKVQTQMATRFSEQQTYDVPASVPLRILCSVIGRKIMTVSGWELHSLRGSAMQPLQVHDFGQQKNHRVLDKVDCRTSRSVVLPAKCE